MMGIGMFGKLPKTVQTFLLQSKPQVICIA